jgi:hypothetical protein
MFTLLSLAMAQDVSVSYFGDQLVHPGLKVGVEYPLLSRTSRLRSMERSLYVAPNLGVTWHPEHHTAAFVNGELGYRRTRESGWKRELILGLGAMRSNNASPTYTPDGDRVLLDGHTYVMPSVAVGFGRDLTDKRDLPLAWHVRPTLYMQAPYNTSIVPSLALETGITWSF